MKRLHELAAANDLVHLQERLSAASGDLDSYAPFAGLEDVVIRHGLKGTPLHVAVVSGSVECARLLLELGADPNRLVIQSERGDQEIDYADAMFLAVETGQVEIIQLLREYRL